MFELFDHLRHKIRESNLPPEQQTIKNAWADTPMANSTWSGEENWVKFLILVDGTVIAVEDTHSSTIEVGYKPPDIQRFVNDGGVEGKIVVDDPDPGSDAAYRAGEIGEMNIIFGIKLNPSQIRSIVDLWKKYDCNTLTVDNIGIRKSFSVKIDSTDRLKAVLQYGPEMAEPAMAEGYQCDIYDHLRKIRINESDLPDIQQKIKDKIPSGIERLAFATEYETELIKFLILNDGVIIPVKVGHGETVRDCGTTVDGFNLSGGIMGRIMPGENILLFNSTKNFGDFTDKQIHSFVKIYNRYKAKELISELKSGIYNTPIRCGDQLAAVLQYGPEMAIVAADERINESALSPIQTKIKAKYKSSFDLPKSTYRGEEDRRKFIILSDGTMIPVEHSHWDAIAAADDTSVQTGVMPSSVSELVRDGGIQGTINNMELDLFLCADYVPNISQVKSILKIYDRYRPKKLVIDHNYTKDGDLRSVSYDEAPIKNREQLEAVLQHGFEMAVAATERIRESELPPDQAEILTRIEPSFDLQPSTWSGEENWYKFLVLNDGSVIPVEQDHASTLQGRSQYDFEYEGGIAGRFSPDDSEIDLWYKRTPNKAQLDSIAKLYNKFPMGSFYSNIINSMISIDSADRLIAVLQYGPEMAVAPSESMHRDLMNKMLRLREDKLPDVQLTIKNRKGSSGGLKYNTFPGEERWYKFLVLVDGSVIPVKHAHMETIAGDPTEEDWIKNDPYGDLMAAELVDVFMDTGGIQGKVDPDLHEMDVDYMVDPTDKQIKSLVELWKQYRCTTLFIDSTNDSCSVEIDSPDRLAAVLQYGPEMAIVAADECKVNEAIVPGKAGFIKPNGSLITFEDKNMLHITYAVKWMRENGVDIENMGQIAVFREFFKRTKYIRWYTAANGSMSIEFTGSITMAQLNTIDAMAKNGPTFYWDYYKDYEERYANGNDLQTFHEMVVNDLIRGGVGVITERRRHERTGNPRAKGDAWSDVR